MTVNATNLFATKRLKHVVMLRRSRADGSDSTRPYVGLDNVESWTGRFTGSVTTTGTGRTAASPDEASLGNTFEPGDVLFAKLRPYLAKAWVASFAGQSTNEFLIMRPLEIEPRFLRYVCVSRDFIGAVDASTYGSKMPRAEWSYIGNLSVPVPPIEVQRSIADYLDGETARIDNLSERVRATIELLNERRGSLIANAVTGQRKVERIA